MKSKFKQRLQYTTRLQQGETPEAIFDDLINLLQVAETYADQNNSHQALDVYAQIIDVYLSTDEVSLIALFDRAITEFLPQLNMLLLEISSLVTSRLSEVSKAPKMPDPSTPMATPTSLPTAISPLLPLEARRHWLERLFALWLKRIDISQISKHLQVIILEVAWREDIPYLRHLLEAKDQPTSPAAQSKWDTYATILRSYSS